MSRFYPTAGAATPGVHATAVVGKNVQMGAIAYIGPHAVVGDGARVGVAGAYRGGHCVVGKRVVLGEGCVLHPHVTVYDNVDIGRGAILHSGCVIGADGFGYVLEHGAVAQVSAGGAGRDRRLRRDRGEFLRGSCRDRGDVHRRRHQARQHGACGP